MYIDINNLFKKKIKSNLEGKFRYDKFIMKIPVYNYILVKNIIIRFSKI